jgi:hypothetical protein
MGFVLVFARCGAHEEAMDAFQKKGNWQQVFCMAAILGLPEQKKIEVARNLAGKLLFSRRCRCHLRCHLSLVLIFYAECIHSGYLKAHNSFADAARVLEDYALVSLNLTSIFFQVI